jgi:hypothetical protein
MRFSAIRAPLVFEDGERRDGSAELECLSFDDSSRAMRLVHSMPVFQSAHCVAVVPLQTHITAHYRTWERIGVPLYHRELR